jgi:hypothetical protein
MKSTDDPKVVAQALQDLRDFICDQTAVGIDLGIKNSVTLSDGTIFANPALPSNITQETEASAAEAVSKAKGLEQS